MRGGSFNPRGARIASAPRRWQTARHDPHHRARLRPAARRLHDRARTPGTARAQDFPVDAESVALFRREGLTASLTNVWRVEVDPAGTPDARFAYQLTREGEHARSFRVEFDLTRPIAPPPAPWGH